MKLLLISAVLVVLASNYIFAQCPPPAEFANRLSNIENSAAPDPEILLQLRQLYELHTTCKAPKDSTYARLVHRLGNFYRLTGNIEKGISYTKEAISINSARDKATDKSFLVNSYFNLGLCYWQENLYTEAQLYFDSCIELGTRYPAKYHVLFMAFEKKAYTFFQTGDYQKSIETAENGILWTAKAKDSLFEASLLSQKAQSEMELNRDGEAEKNIQRAIGILKNNQDGMNYLAAGYSIYASLLIKKGKPETAIHYYKSSFQLNKKNSEWAQCARDMHNLGYLYDNILSDSSKAMECYKQAIQIVEQTNKPADLLGLYINMGVVYWRHHNYKQALNFYQKGLNVLPIKFTDTSVRHNPSIEMLRLVSNDYYVATLLTNKAEALLDQYKAEKKHDLLLVALNTYEVADKTVDFMRWKQYGEQSKLFWRQKTKSMYEHAIEVCYLLNDIDKALFFFEKSRAVLLNDNLSELGAKRFLTGPDRAKEQELNISISALNQQLSRLNDSDVLFYHTKEQLLSAQESLEKFIKSLEVKYPFYYKYKYDNTTYSAGFVENKILAKDQSLVEYFTGDSSFYILALTHAGNSFVKVSLEDFVFAAKELMELCSNKVLLNGNYPRYRALAYAIYEKLFKPLNIPGGRVIISPDESFIPFEALLSDSHDPTSFLLKKYAFSYAYSIGLLQKDIHSGSSADNSFLGVAPVNYQPYLDQQPLEGADQSLQNIRPYFQSVKFLIKQDATKNQFLKDLSLFNIVQIYSHANADSSGTEPVLYLSDSSVNISDIQNLDDLKASLVVLSACKTGVGKNAKGEGIFSLARAFTAAGISSTVTTLWEIDNKATYQLTETFYKYLSRGFPKDVALQKAKLEFLENNDKTYELPYFWAANIILGKTDAIDASQSKSARSFILILVAILTGISAIVFLIRKHVNSKTLKHTA